MSNFQGTQEYVASEQLLAAVNVAIALQKPLLIKGEPGTGNIVEAVRHMRKVMGEIRTIQGMEEEELWKYARSIEAPIGLVKETAELMNVNINRIYYLKKEMRCFFVKH